MNKCRYCHGDYANPFKMVYSPLWFAWRPVKTDQGVAFLKRVHKSTAVGLGGNLVSTYPVFWSEYHECEAES
jgi:hypothetical protein